MEDVLLYFALKYNGDFNSIYKALESKEVVDYQLYEKLKSKFKSKYTTLVSNDYPNKLKEIDCPPFVLFYYGDLSLLEDKIVTVVGKRKTSEYGKRITKIITSKLVKNDYTVLSGMSIGTDVIAHQTAINENGKSIAISGCGIDMIYPKSNQELYNLIKNNHLLISEYPFDTKPEKKRFIKSNRLISGLSDEVIVTECDKESYSMIVTRFAIEQSKNVYCVPSNIDTNYQGCNELIKHGADIFISVEDLDY